MAKSAKKPVAKEEEVEYGPIRMKVSEKGAISVYDIRRFPITFYRSEWEWLFAKAEAIRDFAERHADELKAETETGRKAIEGTETA